MTTPTRVGDLFLPTLLTLATRGPTSTKNFLSLLPIQPRPTTHTTTDATPPETTAAPPPPGTRVTAQTTPANLPTKAARP